MVVDAAAIARALVALTSVTPAGAQPSEPAGPAIVYVQPLGAGDLADGDVDQVADALARKYGFRVRVLPRQALPAAAYYPPRRRYRAERLLDYLRERLPSDGLRVVGVTAADISTTKDAHPDWGVLGLGDIERTWGPWEGPQTPPRRTPLGGAELRPRAARAAVVSLFRCRKHARDAGHARERLAKVAIHELGHTLGLEHCPNPGCIMQDARGKVATTDADTDLCARCRGVLKERGFKLPR